MNDYIDEKFKSSAIRASVIQTFWHFFFKFCKLDYPCFLYLSVVLIQVENL